MDLVFLDWMMPKSSGFQFLSSIRGTAAFQTSPAVVMLTAETNSEQINSAMKYNVSTYLTKPFTKEQLVAAVRQALEGEVRRAV